MKTITLDFETTTFNFGNPYDNRNRAVAYSWKVEDGESYATHERDPQFFAAIRSSISEESLLVGTNLKFDLSWYRNCGGRLPECLRIWDVQLAGYYLSGQTVAFASLNDLLEYYGGEPKLDRVKEYWDAGIDTADIPPEIVLEYVADDVDKTYWVYCQQQKDPRLTPELRQCILLAGLDLLVLQEMENNGIKYDSKGSLVESERNEQKITELEELLRSYSIYDGINFDSGDELSCYLYGGTIEVPVREEEKSVYKSGPRKGEERIVNRLVRVDTYEFPGFFNDPGKKELLKKSQGETDRSKMRWSTSASTLAMLPKRNKIQKEIIAALIERAKLTKINETYLKAIPALMEEMHWGEWVHGQYNQVVVRTTRLSSSKPNMQNTPPQADKYFVTRF